MTNSKLQLAEVLGQPSTDKRLDILRRIGQVGSISEAARGAGVSYKAGWQAIDTLSNLAGLPLVEKLVGGAGGGGAQLTPAGQRVLAAADRMNQARWEVLQQIERDAPAAAGLPNLSALALRTSMRNQLPCTVKAIQSRAGALLVELHLSDQTPLVARITRESAELLGLKPGLAVLALCKATAVAVDATQEPAPGRNLFKGLVSRASRSTTGGEVALTLACGLQLVGFTAPGVVLKVRQSAMALVETSAVVVAVTH